MTATNPQSQPAACDAAEAAAPSKLTFDSTRRQVFVVGNEAADVDSLVSAYAMAELLDGSEIQGVALAQIPREEFRLRGDALALFLEAGIELAADGTPVRLCFWDEVCRDTLSSLPSRSVVLTDHNKMTAQAAEIFEGRVEQILDHHAKTNSHPEARTEIAEDLGSACTLVVEQFVAANMPISRQLGTLLAGVILLDTRNFDPDEGKGTPRDKAALERISEHIPPKGATAWYTALMEARLDCSHLSVRELALVDNKVATAKSDGSSVAFSSIPATLAETVERAGGPAALVNEIQALAAKRQNIATVLLFKKDKATGRKAVAFIPQEVADGRGACICKALAGQLSAAAPGTFPEEFANNPLFATQGLLENGFQMQAEEDMLPLMAFSVRGTISRKTLLPYAMAASAL